MAAEKRTKKSRLLRMWVNNNNKLPHWQVIYRSSISSRIIGTFFPAEDTFERPWPPFTSTFHLPTATFPNDSLFLITEYSHNEFPHNFLGYHKYFQRLNSYLLTSRCHLKFMNRAPLQTFAESCQPGGGNTLMKKLLRSCSFCLVLFWWK